MAGLDSYVKLLTHMNGDDDGTVFTDSSESAHTITRYTTVTKTGIKQLGTASAYFNGSGYYLTVPNHADWGLDTGDFTIDCWFRPGSTSIRFGLWGQMVNSGTYQNFYMDTNSSFRFQRVEGVSNKSYIISSTGHITVNTWHHVALVRSSSAYRIYIDGVNRTSSVNGESYSLASLGVEASLGRVATGATWNYSWGHMDEFRFSKGVARWTSNFTPPTAEYSSADISGNLTEEARILILDENSWAIEHNAIHSAGDYVIPEGAGAGTKSVTAYPTDTDKAPITYTRVIPVA